MGSQILGDIGDPAAYSIGSILLLVRLIRSETQYLNKLEDHLGSADLSVLYRQPLSCAQKRRKWKEGRGKKNMKPTSSSLSPGRIESKPDLTEVGFGLIPYSEINLGTMGTKFLYHFSVSGLAGTVWPFRNSNDWSESVYGRTD
jgi:hypothetical protein